MKTSWVRCSLFVAITGTLLLFASCNKTMSYDEMLYKELESGEVYEDLFLGMELGMTSKQFYAQCWELNKEQKIMQGPGNLSVQYEPEELDYPGTMNFYPDFYEDKIASMPMIFEYKSWAPWNKDMFSDKLAMDVKDMFESWYGSGFKVHDHPKYGKVLAKVDGNREIIIHIKDDRLVEAWINDLRLLNEIRDIRAEESE
ncbi:MAG: hypothetical protein GYB31_15615 [Bacteroidetes bacterium]|nr:hypothetical protein [Bacteroidota bacterium]